MADAADTTANSTADKAAPASPSSEKAPKLRAGKHPHPDNGINVPVLNDCATQDIDPLLEREEFFWLHLEDPNDDKIDALGQAFDFHPLAVRSAKNFGQRPKLDIYDDVAYLVYYGAHPAHSQDELLHEIHLFISGDYIITIHRGEDDALVDLLKSVPERKMRSKQFLIYEVLATIADSFFPLLSGMDEDIAAIEDAVLKHPSAAQLQRINALKHDLITLRRVVTPQRDIFARNIEALNELNGLETDHSEYFRDIYDHLIRVSDLVDSYRDLASGTTDLYLSTVANRQGEVGKQLAVVATIFLPLSFLTGFFGQNFGLLTNHYINQDWTFWPFGIGSLIVSVLILLWFFKRKGWLNDDTAIEPPPPRRHIDAHLAARPHLHKLLNVPTSKSAPANDTAEQSSASSTESSTA